LQIILHKITVAESTPYFAVVLFDLEYALKVVDGLNKGKQNAD